MKLKLYAKDPLAVYLIDKRGFTPITSLVVGFFVYFLLGYVLGWWLSTVYANDPAVDKIWLGPQRLAAPVSLVLLPAFLAWIYVHQPLTIANMIESLALPEVDLQRITQLFNRPRWSVLALITAIGVTAGWYALVALPAMKVGLRPWWDMNADYRCVFLAMVALAIYLGVMTILWQVLAIRSLDSVFRNSSITIYPLHPDGAGGLASVGHFAMTTAFAGVLVGFWAAAHLSGPVLRGWGPEPVWYLGGLILLYVMLTPTLLVLPVRSAHTRMSRVKREELAKVAEVFARRLTEAQHCLQGQVVADYNQALQAYLERHRIIRETYPEWPFRTPELRRFGVATVVPVILQVAKFAYDLYTQTRP